MVRQFLDGIRKCDGSQIIAILKDTAPHFLHRVGNRNGGKRLAMTEGRVAYKL